MKKFITAAFVVVVFSGIGYWQLFSAPQGKNATPEYIQIRTNERVGDIADELKAKNIIRSSAVFLIDAKIIGLDTKILPGRYQVDGSVNVQGIINALMHPKNFEVSVTVPEGFTVQDIDARLTKMGLISSGDFSLVARPLEGFLFPDTYFVIGNNFKPASLVKKMNDTFLRKFTPEMQSAVAEHKRTLKDVIIMASILEKEVNKKNDYPIVAGILWKRLDSGWPLQADAAFMAKRCWLSVPLIQTVQPQRILIILPKIKACRPPQFAIQASWPFKPQFSQKSHRIGFISPAMMAPCTTEKPTTSKT